MLGDPVNHLDNPGVGFETPTELKAGGETVERPEFGILVARIRDRISTLRALFDDGPLTINFREFGERAEHIRITRCNIHHVDRSRRSSRTGQVHSLGGFVGEGGVRRRFDGKPFPICALRNGPASATRRPGEKAS